MGKFNLSLHYQTTFFTIRCKWCFPSVK